jgi:hypothetical protein
MQLRTQINKFWRPDGDTLGLPMTGHFSVVNACGPQRRNHYVVNTSCATDPDYGSFYNYAWNHEDSHMLAALDAAIQEQGDLHSLWEPLVSSWGDLNSQVEQKRFSAHAFIVESAQCTHTGFNPTFSFFVNQGSGWLVGSIILDESRPPHCI